MFSSTPVTSPIPLSCCLLPVAPPLLMASLRCGADAGQGGVVRERERGAVRERERDRGAVREKERRERERETKRDKEREREREQEKV